MTRNEAVDLYKEMTYLKVEDQKEAYLEYCLCTKRLSMNSVSAYEIDLSQFIEYLKVTYPEITKAEQVTKCVIQAYIQAMSSHLAVSSTKRKVAALKGFFNYLVEEEVLEDSPFSHLRLRMKEPKRLPEVLSLKEINAILKAAYNDDRPTSDLLYHRDIAILEVLFETGIRVHELCNLKYCDYSPHKNSFTIIGKGNKERRVYLTNPGAIFAFETYLRTVKKYRIKNEYIFISKYSTKLSTQAVRNLVTKYAKLAKIKRHITPHAFRHSFASLLLESNVDLKHIQEFLGHSSITTTQIYLHLNEETSRKILKDKHPRKKLKF